MGGNINAGYAAFESAGSEGSSDISGTADFGTSCFASGKILAGTFPTGSFMIGTSVVLAFRLATAPSFSSGRKRNTVGFLRLAGNTRSPAARAIKLAQHCYMMTHGAIEPRNTPTSLPGNLHAMFMSEEPDANLKSVRDHGTSASLQGTTNLLFSASRRSFTYRALLE